MLFIHQKSGKQNKSRGITEAEEPKGQQRKEEKKTEVKSTMSDQLKEKVNCGVTWSDQETFFNNTSSKVVLVFILKFTIKTPTHEILHPVDIGPLMFKQTAIFSPNVLLLS